MLWQCCVANRPSFSNILVWPQIQLALSTMPPTIPCILPNKPHPPQSLSWIRCTRVWRCCRRRWMWPPFSSFHRNFHLCVPLCLPSEPLWTLRCCRSTMVSPMPEVNRSRFQCSNASTPLILYTNCDGETELIAFAINFWCRRDVNDKCHREKCR